MRPEYEKIVESNTQSFTCKEVIRENRPLLTQAWHYHPEIEVCFTRKSSGNRYVGNKISDYNQGDLVLIGSMLPHGFTTQNKSEQVVIQFNLNFLGDDLFEKPEFSHINTLFAKAISGLQFEGSVRNISIDIIERMLDSNGFKRVLYLFELLDVLGKSNDAKSICSIAYSGKLSVSKLNRIKMVFDYVGENFKRDITLQEAARHINLTESAFYKFIKKHTKKKFTQIVNEHRANYASKLLIESEKNISEICYESGYNNLSYFNRRFKEIFAETPTNFRDKYKGNNI